MLTNVSWSKVVLYSRLLLSDPGVFHQTGSRYVRKGFAEKASQTDRSVVAAAEDLSPYCTEHMEVVQS